MKRFILAALCLPILPLYAIPLKVISPSQVTSSVFSIINSGLYVLSDDISYTTAAGTAISITTSDVTLDLNGKTIRGSNASSTAIFITSAFENIIIKNGSLVGFEGNGISVAPGSKNLAFENLIISGTSINAAAFQGFEFNGSVGSTLRIANVVIRNCHASNGFKGLRALASDNFHIEDSTFNKNGFIGMDVDDTRDWIIKNCQCSGSNSTSNLGCDGARTLRSSNWLIKNSDFSSNFNAEGAIGFGVFDDCRAFIFEDCTFNNNGATSLLEGEGLDLFLSFSCLVRNCVANGNFASTGTAVGFVCHGNGSGNMFENCVAVGNTVRSSSNAYGFQIGSEFGPGSRVSLLNCTAQSNSSQSPAKGIGFFVNSASANCVLKDCLSISNTHTGFSIDSTSAFLTGNLAMANPVNYAGIGTFGFVSVTNGAQPGAGSFDERWIDNISVV